MVCQELKAALLRAYPEGRTTLADEEAAYVAIAYNAGSVDFTRGLKQGHRNPGETKYYGEYIAEYLALSKKTPSGSAGVSQTGAGSQPLPVDVAVQPVDGPSAFAQKLVAVATGEWEFFGKQSYDESGNAVSIGHKEGEEGFYQRVAGYWLDGTDTRGIDGRDHEWPWSAAFISWCEKASGAGCRFRYSTQHSVYISQAIRDHLNGSADAGYWGWRLNERKPSIGDLVCWSRESGIDYDHQNRGDYKGHCDVVVVIGPDSLDVIGGNVGDSVTKRTLALTASGFLKPAAQRGETLFALMQNRIDLPMTT